MFLPVGGASTLSPENIPPVPKEATGYGEYNTVIIVYGVEEGASGAKRGARGNGGRRGSYAVD